MAADIAEHGLGRKAFKQASIAGNTAFLHGSEA